MRQSALLNAIVSVVQPEEDKDPSCSFQTRSGQDGSIETISPRTELILVAEDHPVNQEVALLLLRNLGFEAHIAKNGLLVLEMIKRTPYSLIFMDCQMPELGGFEAARSIRKIEALTGKHIPIIAMTAHAIEGSREQCLAAGMDDYISKPIDPKQLSTVINEWLPLNESSLINSAHSHAGFYQPACDQGPVDVEELERKFGHSVATQLLSMFRAQAGADVAGIRRAIQERDEITLTRSTHALKGVFSTVCAHPLAMVTDRLEKAIERGDWDQANMILSEFEQSVTALVQFTEEFLNCT
jgi:CheY-like chemotaxis protein/HPt (histidine-containing phosphotransfer) domain-containing protein